MSVNTTFMNQYAITPFELYFKATSQTLEILGVFLHNYLPFNVDTNNKKKKIKNGQPSTKNEEAAKNREGIDLPPC